MATKTLYHSARLERRVWRKSWMLSNDSWGKHWDCCVSINWELLYIQTPDGHSCWQQHVVKPAGCWLHYNQYFLEYICFQELPDPVWTSRIDPQFFHEQGKLPPKHQISGLSTPCCDHQCILKNQIILTFYFRLLLMEPQLLWVMDHTSQQHKRKPRLCG